MNEKLIEMGEFIHESLLNGSSKTNPAFDEAMLLFVCNSLTILKEQEPVKPSYTTPPSIYSWECGVCAEPFDRIANYCPKCGRKVKWDE